MRDEAGNLVYDSGNDFERITAAVDPENFNSTNDENGSFDSRSDDKGPEPEGVEIGRAFGSTYAFIGLERVGGIMVYNIDSPSNSWTTSTTGTSMGTPRQARPETRPGGPHVHCRGRQSDPVPIARRGQRGQRYYDDLQGPARTRSVTAGSLTPGGCLAKCCDRLVALVARAQYQARSVQTVCSLGAGRW